MMLDAAEIIEKDMQQRIICLGLNIRTWTSQLRTIKQISNGKIGQKKWKWGLRL